jgi:hypothetical protein
MQILESALAFAITMLVLSLTCSSFVEIVHRVFSMREAGLQYMLGQMFDQVLNKYFDKYKTAIPGYAQVEADALRQSFVERMSSNRTPLGVTPKELPTDPDPGDPAAKATRASLAAQKTPADPSASYWQKAKNLAIRVLQVFHLWNGRELSSMTAAEFMERLGSTDFGAAIKQANDAVGAKAADTVDAVLKDIAQKFDALGKEAAGYFEGRARLLSVCVAVVLAFAIRVDAIELFNTFLRDPNARNKVIEQTQAVTAQYKAMTEAATALKANTSEDAKQQVEDLRKDLTATMAATRSTVKQYADLGLPIGWTKENATLNPKAPTCSKDGVTRVVAKGEACKTDETAGKVGWRSVIRLVGSLLLGGLLIGLGAPFWYDAVTGLTNIRGTVQQISGSGQQKATAPAAPGQPADAAPQPGAPAQPAATPAPTDPDRPQPVTPVGTFTISNAARP